MTRTEVLDTVNQIAKDEIHDQSLFHMITNETQTLSETGIDSFDFIMLYLKVGERFEISNKDFKEKLDSGDPTLETFINFILEYSTNI